MLMAGPKNSQKDQLMYGSQWYWTLQGKIPSDQMLFFFFPQAFDHLVYKVRKKQQKTWQKNLTKNVVVPQSTDVHTVIVIYIMHE